MTTATTARKTILITGASSGIGRETARLFVAKGWNVVATMRQPANDTALAPAPNLLKLRLDVLDDASIDAVKGEIAKRFGRLDVLVNNAGYGLVGVFESMPLERVKKQFETNVFGLMRVTQAFLPMMRAQKSGVIINLSSVGGRTTIPLYSVYHATKFAVEGFSDSLQYELAPLGIKVRLIEPGAVKTDFVGRSSDVSASGVDGYRAYETKTMERLKAEGEKGIPASEVADAIYAATIANGGRLRFIVGMQAKAFLFLQRVLPQSVYRGLVTRTFA